MKKTAKQAAPAPIALSYEEQHADLAAYLAKEFERSLSVPQNKRETFLAQMTKSTCSDRITWEAHLLVEADLIEAFNKHVVYLTKPTEENDCPDALHMAIGKAAAELADILARGSSYGGVEFECNSTCGLKREMANLAREAARNILSSMYGGVVDIAKQLRRMEEKQAAKLRHEAELARI